MGGTARSGGDEGVGARNRREGLRHGWQREHDLLADESGRRGLDVLDMLDRRLRHLERMYRRRMCVREPAPTPGRRPPVPVDPPDAPLAPPVVLRPSPAASRCEPRGSRDVYRPL